MNSPSAVIRERRPSAMISGSAVIGERRQWTKIGELADVDFFNNIAEPAEILASAEQLTSHTDEGNELCATVIQGITVWLPILTPP